MATRKSSFDTNPLTDNFILYSIRLLCIYKLDHFIHCQWPIDFS